MQIHRIDPETIVLEDVDVFLWELLLQIAPSADPKGSPAAEQRLFSSPTFGRDPAFDEEWREYVEPDLREEFRSSMATVQADLKEFCAEDADGAFSLTLPVRHLEHWIHALNQARLALAARHDIGEREMDATAFGGDARALAVFQIYFYGTLQEHFLRELEG